MTDPRPGQPAGHDMSAAPPWRATEPKKSPAGLPGPRGFFTRRKASSPPRRPRFTSGGPARPDFLFALWIGIDDNAGGARVDEAGPSSAKGVGNGEVSGHGQRRVVERGEDRLGQGDTDAARQRADARD